MTTATEFELIFTHLHELEPLMTDPCVTEINVYWDGGVYVERHGESQRAPFTIAPDDLRNGAQLIAHSLKGVTLDDRKPRFNGSLPDGSRVAILVPPASHGGITMSIRRHKPTAFTAQELVELGTLPQSVLDILEPAITNTQLPASVAISGPTGVGKTSLLNALAGLIDPRTRVGFIEEDAPELKKQHFPNHFPFVTTATLTIRDLVREALRHKPERLIVGEVRGAEAAELIDALNTGHPGSFTTLHANSAPHALHRLRTCVLNSDSAPNYQAIGYAIAGAFQYVLQMSRRRLADGEGKRIVTELIRVTAYNPSLDRFESEPLYSA